jgi:hypothetical protein
LADRERSSGISILYGSMEKMEFHSMKRPRVVFLALGLIALIGLSAPEARAENVTISLTWTGGSTSIDFTSPFAQAGSTANNLTVDTGVLNLFLAVHGSNMIFVDLGAASNNPGDPGGSILSLTGEALKIATPGANAMTIDASQTGFTTPSGPGTLVSSVTANFNNNPAGTQTGQVSLDATLTPPLSFTSTGSGPNSGSSTNSIAATASAAGYSLDNSAVVNFAGSGLEATDQFTVTTKFTASSIPEPASIVMMLTGMPLPLVVLGLLRRRRAA